jgi:hypothetical protein
MPEPENFKLFEAIPKQLLFMPFMIYAMFQWVIV